MLQTSKQIVNVSLVPMGVTFDADPLRMGLAPIALRQLFCTWTLEPDPKRPEKPKKIPRVRGGQKLVGSYADPDLHHKLMTLDDAIAACDAQGHSGVGLVFTPTGGVVGLDLDHCVVDGKLDVTPEQAAALKVFKKYAFVEYSQSGTGLHAIALGDARTNKVNGELELFGDKNFLALTGARGAGVASTMLQDNIDKVDAIIEEVKVAKKAIGASNVIALNPPTAPATGFDLSIKAVVLKPRDEPKDPERAKSALESIRSPEDYDDWRDLVWAGCAAGVPIEAMIEHSWPDTSDIVRELYASYDSSRPGGIGPGTLFKLALDTGWVPPSRKQSAQWDYDAIDNMLAASGPGDAGADEVLSMAERGLM